MADQLRILGIPGSLRKESFNKYLLRAAVELCPEDAVIETFDLEGIPLFNQDLDQNPPEKVAVFKAKILASHAILFVTPEYNYSIPGVLKNAIDWASRPYGSNAFAGKPCGIMGASVGMIGTARAQYHLRQCCVFLNMYAMNQPEIMVPAAQDKFEPDGRLKDEKTRDHVAGYLRHFIEWARRWQQ